MRSCTLRSDEDHIAEKIAGLGADYIGESSVSSTLESQAKECAGRPSVPSVERAPARREVA